MKTVKYVPKAAQGDDRKFEGHVMLRMPLLEERLELLDKLDLKTDEDGKVELGEAKSRMKFLVDLLKAVRPFYHEVSMKCVASGEEYKCYEDLSSDASCQAMVTEIAGVVLNGLKVGNG